MSSLFLQKMQKTVYSMILVGILLLGACQQDVLDTISPDKGSVFLRVVLPEPMMSNQVSRAGATDFDKIRDINVIIANGEGDDAILEAFYFTGTKKGDPDVRFGDDQITIHFSKDYTTQMGLDSKVIYIVANYGREITGIDNVRELKTLKQESSPSLPGIPSGCMMFAKADDEGEEHTHSESEEAGKTLTAKLERTVAMITVAIDGRGLRDNVIITPTGISLHQVPSACFIGANNNGTEVDIVARGEFKEGAQLDWGSVANATTIQNQGATFSNLWEETGDHYIEGNYGDDHVAPLFLFENLHGVEFGAVKDDERYKRLDGVGQKDLEGITRATATCSYLNVAANYLRLNDDGSVAFTGKVNFRFFIGDDRNKERFDFNVVRNTYYQITLTLTGDAVTEGGEIKDGALETNPDAISWRVVSDLGMASFVTGDVNLNASGEYFPIEVAAGDDVEWSISGREGDTPFLWIYGRSYGSPQWQSVAGTVSGNDLYDGKLWLYAQPLVPDTYIFQDRTCEVTLTIKKNGTVIDTKTITVTQYAPIQYTASGEYIEEIFGHSPVNVLIDKIDREAMPWGFKGEVLDFNHSDGYRNAFHLIDKNDPDGHQHWQMAQRYLPFGTNNGGSAMVYSMMFYGNPSMAPSLTPEQLMSTTEFPDLDAAPSYTDWYWTLPSIAGWQIIEKASKEGKLDEHPIYDFFQYWTSDAVTTISKLDGGDKRAYTYQFGRGLDSLKDTDVYPSDQMADRDKSLRFRLIAVKKVN